MPSDQQILRKIAQQPKQAAAFKQLVREFGLHGDERGELEAALEDLANRGDLTRMPGERYAIPQKKASNRNLVSGRLSMHRDGYGFVIPEEESTKSRIAGDIYVNPQAIGNAMHGDRVVVEIGRVRDDGRAEGTILRVLNRAHPTVVGTFHCGERQNYVRPIDEKITADVIIPRGMEVPPAERYGTTGSPKSAKGGQTLGAGRHRVLGGEAQRREIDLHNLENVVVDVEITDWPTPTQNPRGRVVEILGYEDDFGVDVEIIIRKYHLPHRFPDEVLREAQQVGNIIPAGELRIRRDFRDLSIVTIDGETARDFDDAVFVRRLDDGKFELQVHIADVAQYVREGTPLDQEARLRGTSVYFPDRAVPMLPIELSTDICSLRPKVERLVMSCVMQIDHRGEVLGYELSAGVIRSAERMTYTNVNAILEGDGHVRQRYAPLVENFELMRELAMILNRKRERRGSIDFDLPEPVIEFDEHGLMKNITQSERNIANRIIEEFMLAANESVASYLEPRVPSIYRVHEKPDAKKVYDFEAIAAAFGYSLGVGSLPIQRVQVRSDRRQRHGSGRDPSPVEIPEEVHITPRMYQKLTKKIAGKPEERILSYLMLRSLKQARYSEENLGHFALAASTYTHFTSPIRRYPDLIVHRILKDVLRESAEQRDGDVPVGIGVPAHSEEPSPWGKGAAAAGHREKTASPWSKGSPKRAGQRETKHADKTARGSLTGPIPEEALHDIAEESSQSERRADDAERELMDWKKIKFMQDRIGEEFDGLIISVTKFGFFVELTDMFIEGLVPLSTLTDDRYTFHENTRQIIGQRSRKTYSIGNKARVLVDRIDRMQHKIQFAIVEDKPSPTQRSRRR